MNRRGFPVLLIGLVTGAALALGHVPASAQWSGPLTEPWWGFSAGGDVGLTAGAYRLSAAIGQSEASPLTGGVYKLSGGIWTLPLGGAPVAVGSAGAPVAFSVSALAPNPFTRSTTVEFALPTRDRVLAEVFDVRGERVRTLADEVREPGVYRETWNGSSDAGHALGAGVYFVRVRSGPKDLTRRVVHVN